MDKLNRKSTFLVLSGKGPLTRSTFSEDHPDTEWENLSDLHYWCWCTRFQARRFSASLESELRSWQGRRSTAIFAATSFDEHMLMTAAGNLEKALRRLDETSSFRQVLDSEMLRVVHLLRNVYEHWDEQKSMYRRGCLKGSSRLLKKEFPNANPWSFDIYQGDVLIAKVISLSTLNKGIRKLEATVLRRLRDLRRGGKSVPSRTARDAKSDALPSQ